MVRHVFALAIITLAVTVGTAKAADALPLALPFGSAIASIPPAAEPASHKAAEPASHKAAEPASHKAVYVVNLASARSGSGIVSANGEMIYKFSDACEGWTTETHNMLNIVDDHGNPLTSGWDFLSWEAKDGLSYRFHVRSTRDDEEIEFIEGTARLDGKGQGGLAIFTQPEALTIPLPPGTIFPTEHTIALVERPMAGDKSMIRFVFDGTLVAPPFEVNALFSPPLPPGTPSELENPVLDLRPSWRMHMAYFRTDTKDALPYHEVTVRYHDNGVGQELVQDYGTFRLGTRLKKLELLPKPTC